MAAAWTLPSPLPGFKYLTAFSISSLLWEGYIFLSMNENACSNRLDQVALSHQGEYKTLRYHYLYSSQWPLSGDHVHMLVDLLALKTNCRSKVIKKTCIAI